MAFTYDPRKAIDLTQKNEALGFALMGHYGPYPSRPCDVCGATEFNGVDWNLGFRCTNGHTFGTPEEWAWDMGHAKPTGVDTPED